MASPSSSKPQAPIIFDRARVAQRRDRAASTFGEYAFLKERVSRDITERLSAISRTFGAAVDIGAHDGRLSQGLLAGGQVTAITATDISRGMVAACKARGLSAVCMDEEKLALDEASLDLIVSALSLHWVNDLPGALLQIRRALKPDGLFLGATFGAGTLGELRSVLVEAETEISGGIAPRVSPLPALNDAAGLLQRAGFALPVADRDTVTVRYDNMFKLVEDLKGMGERAAFARGHGQPLPRAVLMRAAELYQTKFADPDGRIRATFELVSLSGWAPAPNQQKPLKPGSAKASLSEAVAKIATSKK